MALNGRCLGHLAGDDAQQVVVEADERQTEDDIIADLLGDFCHP